MIKAIPIQESELPIQTNNNRLPTVQAISIPMINQTAIGEIYLIQPTTQTYSPIPNTLHPKILSASDSEWLSKETERVTNRVESEFAAMVRTAP